MNTNIDLNDIKTLYFNNGWPIYEVCDKDDKFICNIELIPDGFIGMDRTYDFHRWSILMDKLCIINEHNLISYIFELIDAKNYIFQGINLFNKNNFYLKYIIS